MATPGRKYQIGASFASLTNPTKTLWVLTSAFTVRPGIFDLFLGSSATPADNALLWNIQRFTAAGTTTAYTPPPIDPSDPAALAAGGVNASAEPTYTSAKILFNLALNQRATHRIIFDPTAPLMAPATASNGLGLYATHASFTGSIDSTVFFFE